MNQNSFRRPSGSTVLTFATALILFFFTASSKVNAQTVNFRVTNYVAISATSIEYDIELQASTTGITLPSNSIEINTNASKTSGVNSASYLGNYTGYSNTSSPSYNSGTTTVATTAPGSPVTISTSFEPYMHVINTSTGTASDNTDVTFGTITGVSVGSTTGLTNQPMPITLISFDAQHIKNNLVEINWSTANEINNDLFEIQKSTDGKEFQTIGKQKGERNSIEVRDYKFIDNEPINNSAYYRLKQIDLNGTITLSEVVTLQKSNPTNFNVYPNPTSESFSVTNPDIVIVYVCDITGRILTQQNLTSEGNNVNISHLPKGVYIVKTLDKSGYATQVWIQRN